jgi:hypothetical protein
MPYNGMGEEMELRRPRDPSAHDAVANEATGLSSATKLNGV